MNSLMVLLFMSNFCHRICDHCYCHKAEDKMSRKTTGDVAKWIVNICKEENVEHLHVSLAGGEPTNNIDNVFYLQDVLKSGLSGYKPGGPLWPVKDKTINFHLHTNGDLLTDEMLREIGSRRISIKLNPVYDSLEEIENKIIKIQKTCKWMTLALALNDVNLPRFPELTKLAIKYKAHLRTNRLYNGGCIPGYVDEYTIQMHKMFDLLLESEWTMYPNWIMESTFPTWEGPKNCYSCGKWWAVIDTDGTIRGCNPDYDTKVGLIYTHLHWKDLKFPQRWSAKNLPECQGCEWITWCQGGCPYTRKLAYGTYDKRTPFCSAFKQLFPKLMLLKDKWLKLVNY
jgi:radical SAM protein with 4Fe4S-binding SPASM domain